MLEKLLDAISKERKNLPGRIPILIKLAPDLEDKELEDALDVILSTDMDGIVATNTTLSRPGLRSNKAAESGGLSGAPLRKISLQMLEKIVHRVNGLIPVVSSGGVMTPEDASQRLDSGAALVQIYTGLVYQGPGLLRKILKER